MSVVILFFFTPTALKLSSIAHLDILFVVGDISLLDEI